MHALLLFYWNSRRLLPRCDTKCACICRCQRAQTLMCGMSLHNYCQQKTNLVILVVVDLICFSRSRLKGEKNAPQIADPFKLHSLVCSLSHFRFFCSTHLSIWYPDRLCDDGTSLNFLKCFSFIFFLSDGSRLFMLLFSVHFMYGFLNWYGNMVCCIFVVCLIFCNLIRVFFFEIVIYSEYIYKWHSILCR